MAGLGFFRLRYLQIDALLHLRKPSTFEGTTSPFSAAPGHAELIEVKEDRKPQRWCSYWESTSTR